MEENKKNEENKENKEDNKAAYTGNLNDIFDGDKKNNNQQNNNNQNNNNQYNANNQNNNNQYNANNQNNRQNFQNQGFNPYNKTNNGMAGKLYPQSKGASNFVKVFISIFLAIMLFASGFLVAYSVIPSEEEKLARWIKNTSDKYFYDVDGSGVDYISNIGNGMVSSLDKYSSFYADEKLNTLFSENEGIFSDTGMILYESKDISGVYVLKVYGKSPAAIKGVKAGDIIKKINDIDVSSLNLSDITDEIRKIQAADADAEISYEFSRYMGNILVPQPAVSFKSEKYNPEFVKYYIKDSTEMTGVNLDADTAYISFEEFSTNADTQFAAQIANFKKDNKTKLILDLRTNFGGSLAILQNVASYLITDSANSDNVLIINAEFNDKSKQAFKTTGNYYDDYGFQKIIVLANDYSASATEVLICAMKDYGTLNGLVGVKTYGKAVMQSYFQYGDKYGMYITTALLFSPLTNETYNTIGFTPEPDFLIPYNLAGEYKYDNQLLKAVELINV